MSFIINHKSGNASATLKFSCIQGRAELRKTTWHVFLLVIYNFMSMTHRHVMMDISMTEIFHCQNCVKIITYIIQCSSFNSSYVYFIFVFIFCHFCKKKYRCLHWAKFCHIWQTFWVFALSGEVHNIKTWNIGINDHYR